MKDGDDEPVTGRRLADTITRYAVAAATSLTAALLAVIVFFYGNLPKEINELREAVVVMQVELRVIKDEQRDLIDANRVSQAWRERLVDSERKIERNTERLSEHERRLQKLEEPFSVFKPNKKK